MDILIDLHCHLLPGIDDGAADLETSLQMARIAADDGVKIVACTPHIAPPVYDNAAADIVRRTAALQAEITRQGIGLRLVAGADVHIRVDLVELLQQTSSPCLQGTSYFLFEPPHHVLPPNVEVFCRSVISAGYAPILTHPERLTWIEQHYKVICALDEMGLVVQLTAGSITGTFGKRAQYWSERMLDEGRVDIIATDAHGARGRPPLLSPARDAIARRHDDDLARRLTVQNPARILKNERTLEKSRTVAELGRKKGVALWSRLFASRPSDPETGRRLALSASL